MSDGNLLVDRPPAPDRNGSIGDVPGAVNIQIGSVDGTTIGLPDETQAGLSDTEQGILGRPLTPDWNSGPENKSISGTEVPTERALLPKLGSRKGPARRVLAATLLLSIASQVNKAADTDASSHHTDTTEAAGHVVNMDVDTMDGPIVVNLAAQPISLTQEVPAASSLETTTVQLAQDSNDTGELETAPLKTYDGDESKTSTGLEEGTYTHAVAEVAMNHFGLNRADIDALKEHEILGNLVSRVLEHNKLTYAQASQAKPGDKIVIPADVAKKLQDIQKFLHPNQPVVDQPETGNTTKPPTPAPKPESTTTTTSTTEQSSSTGSAQTGDSQRSSSTTTSPPATSPPTTTAPAPQVDEGSNETTPEASIPSTPTPGSTSYPNTSTTETSIVQTPPRERSETNKPTIIVPFWLVGPFAAAATFEVGHQWLKRKRRKRNRFEVAGVRPINPFPDSGGMIEGEVLDVKDLDPDDPAVLLGRQRQRLNPNPLRTRTNR